MPASRAKLALISNRIKIAVSFVVFAISAPPVWAQSSIFRFQPGLSWQNFFLAISVSAFIALIYLLTASWLYERRKNAPEPEEEAEADQLSEFQTIMTDDDMEEPEPDMPRPTREWSTDWLDSLDAPSFERLCVRVWRLSGTSIEWLAAQDVDGVDFYMRSAKTKTRMGAVRCFSCQSPAATVQDVRKLLEIKIVENLPVALLMYNGDLSAAAQATIDHPKIKVNALGSQQILEKIMSLPEELQDKLNINTPGSALSEES